MNALAHDRSIIATITDIKAAVGRLAICTRTWSIATPTRSELDEAMRTGHGLQQSLAQLRSSIKARSLTGEPDAA